MITATCHTQGCPNADEAIDVTELMQPGEAVDGNALPKPSGAQCGVCGQLAEITETANG